MDIITHFLQNAFSTVVPLIVLLGLLIFVHEGGHFLVAKFFKVRVETFSLGFGPKLFKFKRGDTVYAISAIPLGGYVKMYGDDPTADIPADQKAHSFQHKPVGQRIAVVLAGPLMNFFFAILIFSAIALLGENTLSPVTGDIAETSAAHAVGFRSGDEITQVNSATVKSWDEVQKAIDTGANQSVHFEVKHADGVASTFDVTPKLIPNPNVLSWDRTVGEIEGLGVESRASVIGVLDPKSPAAVAGLKTGDVITKIGDTPITKWREVVSNVSKHAGEDQLKVSIERGNFDTNDDKKPLTQDVTLNLTVAQGKTGIEAVKAVGMEFPELYLAVMEKDTPAAKAGLEKGDRLMSIDGQKVESFEQVAGIVRSFGTHHPGATKGAPPVGALAMVVSRNGEEKNFSVSPNMKKRMSNQGQEEQRFEIGIRPFVIDAAPTSFKSIAPNPLAALERGVQQTVKWSGLTVLSFVRLFEGSVSAKSIGGFLSIGQMAKHSWQLGLTQFLFTMAFISINLFVLNLLPVPVLDGGHLVFYSIEMIKGAPLSMRKMEIAQQVGMVLLLCLMVFALFNDFSRMFGAG